MNERPTRLGVYLIAFILIILVVVLSVLNTGTQDNKRKQGINNYNTIDDLLNKNKLIKLPDSIKNIQSEVQIESVMDKIITVYSLGDGSIVNNKEITLDKIPFVIKIMPFVDVNADPLGLYETSEVDNKYNIDTNSDDSIAYFRYREGYTEYKNCTLINWIQGTRAYGMIVESKITEDMAIKILGINKEDLINVKNTDKEDTVNKQRYTFGNKFSLEIPIFKSNLLVTEDTGITFFYINKKLVFIVIYNDYDINNNSFSGESEVQLAKDIVIKYLNDNPFEIGTDAYIDYELLKKEIRNIQESLKYE